MTILLHGMGRGDCRMSSLRARFPIGQASALALAVLACGLAVGCSSPTSVPGQGAPVASTVAATEPSATSPSTEAAMTGDDGMEYVSDEVIVVFRAGTTASAATAALAGTQSVVAQEVTQEELDQSLPYVVVKTSAGHTVDQAISELEQVDVIESAQRNHVLHTMS
jgi:hypothetical protein